jgi:hypothetical protein
LEVMAARKWSAAAEDRPQQAAARQQRHTGGTTGEVVEQQQRGRIGPVQVVDHDHQAAGGFDRAQHSDLHTVRLPHLSED